MPLSTSTFSNIFSEATGPVDAKFHMAPPLVGGKKVCSNGHDHMTKMATCPYMVKIFKKIFFGTDWPMSLKHGIQYHALVCSND